ncbi:MAG: SPFH domain-containing protein [Actinobacteria bacterium]|nr:SPFH domain-containing protein [Actinomycetota bacterium]
MIVAFSVSIAVLAVLVLVASRSARIIREYQRVVLFRLGRSVGAKGPGLIFINPITDRISLVDLRELFLEIPHQTAITKDNAAISIDFIMFYKVLDPVMSVVQVRDFSGAALNIAATTLRSVVGEMTLDDVLSKREEMNNALRTKLDDVTERWGVKVTNVEVREINPPPAVQEAMTRQMSAERTRRAVVTESEGQRQAAITVAEGQKQSAILAAEGQRQAVILAAEAEKTSAVLRAQGLAGALDAVTGSAHDADPNTMALQYLDALRQMASAPSTKFVLPRDLELTNLLAGVRNLAEQFPTTTSKSGSSKPIDISGNGNG